MTSPAFIRSRRSLDSEKQRAIEYFYRPSSGVWLFLATFLPITFGLSIGAAFFDIWWGLGCGVLIAVIWAALKTASIRKKIRQAVYVYAYGEERELVCTGISSNYGLKVNGRPQQVISLLVDGAPTEIRTFDAKCIQVYSIPRQTAFIDSEYKNVIVPSGLFLLSIPEKRRSVGKTVRRTLVFLLPLGFVFGLTYFISSEMNANSHTSVQPDAVVYRQGGKLILASVMTHFQASQIKNGTVYGSDSYYAAGFDLSSGKRIWKTRLNIKDPRGQSFGGGRLLGQSDKYLFFLRNVLYVVEKATGKVVMTGNDFPGLKGRLLDDALADYESDASFVYSDSLQAVVIKGADGLFYTIDGVTLKTGTIVISNPDEYFKNPFRYGNNYEDQLTAMYDDGRHCLAVLDPQDTLLLAHDGNHFRDRDRKESVRRSLYSAPSTNNDAGWTTLNSGIFLYGGFLTDAGKRSSVPDDSLSKYEAYEALRARYNPVNAPLRTRAGGFVLLSKATIETDALLELTGLSAEGHTIWHYSTNYSSIPLMYHDEEANVLYIAGNSLGENGDHLNQMTAIDLATGAVRQYSLK